MAASVTAMPLWSALLLAYLAVSAQVGEARETPTWHQTSNLNKLSRDFYKASCPQFETIVSERLVAATAADSGQPASLTRLFFHDSFVQGLDASILLLSTPNNTAEIDASRSATLVGFDTIGDMKAHLEAACPETVSCSDIIVATAKKSIAFSGGPTIDFEYGRRDSLTSSAELVERDIPVPTEPLQDLLKEFWAKGFDSRDVVALSGAHTFGQSHCQSFVNRLYPGDPTLKSSYRDFLRTQCPDNSSSIRPLNATNQVFMDPLTPNTFDNQYYVALQNNEGLFNTDEELEYFTGDGVKKLVQIYAEDQDTFFWDFSWAMKKLSYLGILTGSEGQIRVNCSCPNTA